LPADRRLYKRYEIQADEIQVVIPPGQRPCFIKNFSTGGLAIEYSPRKDEPFKSESVDIIARGFNKLCLSKIACKTVYDISTLMEGRSFKGGAMRIRGLKFVELNKEQGDKLDILLNSCFDRSAR